MTYDAAGRVKKALTYEMTWDPSDSMLKRGTGEADWEFYVYDASGERIGRTDREVWNWTICDTAGRAVREYESWYYPGASEWIWIEDRFYWDGRPMVIEREATEGGTWYLHTDHLGSVRVVTNQAAQQISRHVYAPYGTELTSMRQAVARGFDEQPQRFTGHERDFTGGTIVENQNQLDYMHARYYSPVLGRFLSVDPVLQVKRAMRSPQLWNRYSYALNNPVIYTDPTGKSVYVVMHTVGNAEGDDEFRRAAMTRATQIRAQKGFDPRKDTVLVRGVASKESFAKVIKEANGLQSTFGNVGQVNMFSHGGPAHGPMFQQGTANQSQDPGFLASVRVNWDRSGSACFFACNSGVNFTQMYATAQGVSAYGYEASASFSSTPNEWSLIRSTGPVYLIQTTGWSNGGPWGALGKWFGFNDDAVPMDRDDP